MNSLFAFQKFIEVTDGDYIFEIKEDVFSLYARPPGSLVRVGISVDMSRMHLFHEISRDSPCVEMWGTCTIPLVSREAIIGQETSQAEFACLFTEDDCFQIVFPNWKRVYIEILEWFDDFPDYCIGNRIAAFSSDGWRQMAQVAKLTQLDPCPEGVVSIAFEEDLLTSYSTNTHVLECSGKGKYTRPPIVGGEYCWTEIVRPESLVYVDTLVSSVFGESFAISIHRDPNNDMNLVFREEFEPCQTMRLVALFVPPCITYRKGSSQLPPSIGLERDLLPLVDRQALAECLVDKERVVEIRFKGDTNPELVQLDVVDFTGTTPISYQRNRQTPLSQAILPRGRINILTSFLLQIITSFPLEEEYLEISGRGDELMTSWICLSTPGIFVRIRPAIEVCEAELTVIPPEGLTTSRIEVVEIEGLRLIEMGRPRNQPISRYREAFYKQDVLEDLISEAKSFQKEDFRYPDSEAISCILDSLNDLGRTLNGHSLDCHLDSQEDESDNLIPLIEKTIVLVERLEEIRRYHSKIWMIVI